MYKYLDHQADMGIYAEGCNWPEVFVEGARAVFNLMFKINKKQLTINKKKEVKVSAKDMPLLFIEWLNELLAQKDIENMVFTEFDIKKFGQENGQYVLEAKVAGEKFDKEKFEPKLEVKAATYSGLECGEKDGKKFCQCVVDV